MTMTEAIATRCSRRKYMDAAMTQQDIGRLSTLIDQYRQQAGVKMHLALDNGEAFNGFRKSYGMFSGVRNYVALIENTQDPHSLEKLGYYGQLLVLGATILGLGTCWVGGSFDRTACTCPLEEGERLVCAIPIGPVEEDLSRKEKLIRAATHRKSKTVQQLTETDSLPPDWFWDGVQAVQHAPSAVNRQPVRFYYRGGVVTAGVEDESKDLAKVDMGIAKLHFEIGAGGGRWDFGNHRPFHYDGNHRQTESQPEPVPQTQEDA